VVAFGVGQAQGPGHRGEYLGAGVDRPTLFEPGVPGDADPGELGDLLAAEPWGAPPGARRDADLVGCDPFAS
jgi:hypothetical protein